MAYTINHYNGTLLATVADGTINTSTDLTLIGKNYAGYGQAQNDNFVWLLENFANTTQPPNPLTGQVWFDSGNNKLKFYDGARFRTTGGAETGSTAPTGLTQGDFWFNTATNQVYAYTGTGFTLIGPQAVTGSGTTQMQSSSVQDVSGATHAIIQAIDNGQTIFIISADSAFTLDGTINPITGFATIQQGVTLCYTDNNSLPGQTTSSHRFWGTASNADKLGGLPMSNFVQAGSANFSTVVNFADVGFTVGNPISYLKIYNNGATTPTIQNQVTDTIVFETTVSSITQTPLVLKGSNILPGTASTTNLGSSLLPFQNLYANYVYSTAQQADALNVGGTYRTASVVSSANSIAVRDGSSNISANMFNGTATSANYADLAEKYLPDAPYGVGTVVSIGGEQEITASRNGDRALGAISEKPAYMMNSELEGGLYVALKGRVPVKVIGTVKKGDRLVAFDGGIAIVHNVPNGDVFAIALESSSDADVKLIECVIL